MAVDDTFKRQGLGTEIVKILEEYAVSNGATKMILNARENAIKFYLSLGYFEIGPYQSDTGIPHKTMQKDFISQSKGAITRLTIAMTLIKIFMEGPEVSLKGSPTVSPTTAAE